jgi:hypothetical protein
MERNPVFHYASRQPWMFETHYGAKRPCVKLKTGFLSHGQKAVKMPDQEQKLVGSLLETPRSPEGRLIQLCTSAKQRARGLTSDGSALLEWRLWPLEAIVVIGDVIVLVHHNVVARIERFATLRANVVRPPLLLFGVISA